MKKLFSALLAGAMLLAMGLSHTACGGQYLKVALGKGLITEERLVALVERYGSFFD